MIVAHLIGGNAIKGIIDGIVIINGEQLETSYQELASVCGSISLGDLDTTRSAERMQRDYIELVREHDEDLDEDFVLDNHLTAEISYSEYEIDMEKKTLKLTIGTYE
ncbi:hypothetical protein [Bacillus thuringiensis]|uniref:hypothetical protein n=1 Tax=Bacillus cereus group TaxID=86661 RepID=UPI000BF52A2C|nr:hypothetical protein [Bacillus thuringiensis]PEV64217.1 hypothetical protein CN434_25750 [Bacillus thuringiensis]